MPRNTQWAKVKYPSTTGIITAAPTPTKICVGVEEEACQSVTAQGTAYGQRLMPSPRKASRNSAIARRNGSTLIATFCQGVILGGYIRGIPVADRAFLQGRTIDFLSAFAVVCGVGLTAGYALLGAAWLIFKTTGTTAAYSRIAARFALLGTLAFIAIVSIWTGSPFPISRSTDSVGRTSDFLSSSPSRRWLWGAASGWRFPAERRECNQLSGKIAAAAGAARRRRRGAMITGRPGAVQGVGWCRAWREA